MVPARRRVVTLQKSPTPYEQFLRESLERERKGLDKLYDEFAHANSVRKQMIQGQIDRAIQNLKLVSYDLEKYQTALSYLRETSKERDELSEHLGDVDEKALAGETTPAKGAAPSAGAQPKPAPATPGKPTIGKPPGAAQTSQQQPPAPAGTVAQAQTGGQLGGTPPARPKIGQSIGTPVVSGQPASRPSVGTPVARPAVGTPIGRPTIGTPIGKPIAPKREERKENAATGGEQSEIKPASPTVGTLVKRPIIGTPIGKPIAAKQEAKKEDEVQQGTASEGDPSESSSS